MRHEDWKKVADGARITMPATHEGGISDVVAIAQTIYASAMIEFPMNEAPPKIAAAADAMLVATGLAVKAMAELALAMSAEFEPEATQAEPVAAPVLTVADDFTARTSHRPSSRNG